MPFVKQECPSTPIRLSNRKSYSILTPISPNRINQSPPKVDLKAPPQKRERIISESTGLVKFALSPKGKTSTTGSKSRSSNTKASPSKLGLPVHIPINPTLVEAKPKTIEDLQAEQRYLLEQYSIKQAQLHEYERKVESKKLELLEISQKLETSKREEVILSGNTTSSDIYKKAYDEAERELSKLKIRPDSPSRRNTLKKKPSFLQQANSLKKQASQAFEETINQDNLRRQASVVKQSFEINPNTIKKRASFINQAFDDLNSNVKKRASTIFTTPTMANDDFQSLIQQSNEKIDGFAKQTTKFFNEVTSTKFFNDNMFNSINKTNPFVSSREEDIANSSFNFDNLKVEKDVDTNSFIYERSFEDSRDEIHIDDYDSSFD
ncbi:uncharacterized protein J8A68_000661 [[Candida] subhashii]|uniref:Uncharacterized protein n=1 Tax=[Candida] subhashii TaxID=561895 RepID=A0A8J5QVF1_9ASCO|nr:uncharacterized protein J8A68_000661 [[Candida] subhashii]KAG7665835.1 hypothetical protein J8A68_000661 [[Candida] subhashii]